MTRTSAIRSAIVATLLTALVALAVARAQPGGPDVRVFNAGVDVPVVDVLVDGDRLFPEIHAGEITSFRPVAHGGGSAVTVRVTRPGDASSELLETSVDLGDSGKSTLVLSGPSSSLRVVRLPDDPPAADRSDRRGHLRLVHASHDAPAVDLVIRGEPARLLDGVEYPNASKSIRVNGGNYDLELRAASGETLVSLPDTYLALYVATTIYLFGSFEGDALSTILVTSSAVRTPDPNTTPYSTNTPDTGGTSPTRTPRRTSEPGRTATPTRTPDTGTGTGTGRAPVRVLHGASRTGDVDVLLDGATLAATLGYATASDYRWAMSGRHRLEVAPTGASAGSALLRVNVSLKQGYNTIVLLDEGQRLTARVVADGGAAPGRGMGGMRFVHAAPDLPPLDAVLDSGMTLASGAVFFEAGRYVSVAPGVQDAYVSRAADGAHVAMAVAFDVAASSIYSCFVVGSESDGNVEAVVLKDAVAPSGPPPTGPGGEAAMRFVHAMPRQSAVDLLVGGLPAETDMPYRRVSDYQRYTGGNYSVRLTKSGSRDSDLAEDELALADATSYSLVGVGTGSEIAFVSFTDDLSRPDVGHARVRFAHVSSDAPELDVLRAGGGVVATGLGFGSASEYSSLPGGFESFAIRVSESGAAALDVAEAWLKPGGVYTVFIMGLAADGSLEAVVARDAEHDEDAMRVLGVSLLPVAHR